MITPERKRIAHLLRRAGFGASPSELDRHEAMGFDGAVEALLDYEPWPDYFEIDPAIEAAFQSDPRDANRRAAELARDLPPWWVKRMVATPNPLEEKMTLFWHGHFTSQARMVQDGRTLVRQNQLLRRNALGNFETLTLDVSRDAAMLVYLDGARSNAEAPNENYGRELMELFTMGIGNYSETDVKQVARALTGWKVKHDSGEVALIPRFQDGGVKTFLGQSGNLKLEDVVRTVVSHPATGPHLAEKLLRFFLRPDPSSEIVTRLDRVYYDSGYSVRAMMEHLLKSEDFSSDDSYRANIKSPAELVVGGIKNLGINGAGGQAARILRVLGQSLFDPPSVKGWDGDRAWISASTLLTRFNVASLVASEGAASRSGGLDPEAMLAAAADDPATAVQHVLELLVDGKVADGARAALLEYATTMKRRPEIAVRGLLRLAMTAPEYQLN